MAAMVASVVALVLGWLAGMLTKARSSHWCPVDGARLSCPQCAKVYVRAAGPSSMMAR
jgi:hypothetical protein